MSNLYNQYSIIEHYLRSTLEKHVNIPTNLRASKPSGKVFFSALTMHKFDSEPKRCSIGNHLYTCSIPWLKATGVPWKVGLGRGCCVFVMASAFELIYYDDVVTYPHVSSNSISIAYIELIESQGKFKCSFDQNQRLFFKKARLCVGGSWMMTVSFAKLYLITQSLIIN